MIEEEKHMTEPKLVYIHPESSLNLLIGPDLRAVDEGSARHVQRWAMATPGLVVSRPDMGDLRVFGWRAWLCNK